MAKFFPHDTQTALNQVKDMKQARQRLQIAYSDESTREPSRFWPPENADDWSQLVENADAGIAVAQVNKFRFVNKRMLELTGCTRQELLSKSFSEIVHPDDRDRVIDLYSRRLEGEEVSGSNTVRIVAKGGQVNWLLATAIPIIWKGKPSVLVLVTNTTPQKRAGEALDESRKTTETLQKACDKLEDLLTERNEEIKHKTLDLAEANTALKILLQRRNEDKTEIEENILTNIKELVAPYLEKVKRKVKDKKLQAYLNV